MLEITDNDFLRMLDQLGKQVTIKRVIKTGVIHHECYSEAYKRFDPLCPVCKGTGRVNNYQLIRTTAEIQIQQPPALVGMDNLYTRVGNLSREYINAYFRKDEKISSDGDYVILDFLEDPVNGIEAPAYRVTQVRRYFGTGVNIVCLFVTLIKEVVDTSGV